MYFVPEPNQIISPVLWQHKIENWKKKEKKIKEVKLQYICGLQTPTLPTIILLIVVIKDTIT